MNDKVKLSRRGFLVAAGAGGAAAAAAVASKVAPQQPAEAAAPGDAQRRGYRLTEHVLSYYRTTKV
ncbi:MAG: twin-arginine translocation signal domain-containing protein [Burkholderiales bacterium]|nr:twin-arginine translocation signal domain-containing protein [Burkholderiales bacterium]